MTRKHEAARGCRKGDKERGVDGVDEEEKETMKERVKGSEGKMRNEGVNEDDRKVMMQV